ncbi:14043_t:CDS:1, partial [Entrophospora sp. SA101]
KKPFYDRSYNNHFELIPDILEGKLPEITNDTPQFYAILMKECWDPNPENRPDFGKIHEDFKKYFYCNELSREEREVEVAENKRLAFITSEKFLSNEKSYKPNRSPASSNSNERDSKVDGLIYEFSI